MARQKTWKGQWVAEPALEPVAGPQADSVEAGQGAPAADPRSPSGPDPAVVDQIRPAAPPRTRGRGGPKGLAAGLETRRAPSRPDLEAR